MEWKGRGGGGVDRVRSRVIKPRLFSGLDPDDGWSQAGPRRVMMKMDFGTVTLAADEQVGRVWDYSREVQRLQNNPVTREGQEQKTSTELL